MQRRNLVLGLLALAAVSLMGCGGGSSDGGRDIGPAGGQVFDAQARANLTIPAGALTTTRHFVITSTTNFPADARVVSGTTYTITPADATFATPATLTIKYDPTKIPAGKTEAGQALCKSDPTSATPWTKVPNSMAPDQTNKTVTAMPVDTNKGNAFGILALQ
jgi:hypothetical protein